jgi:hypothetical protein
MSEPEMPFGAVAVRRRMRCWFVLTTAGECNGQNAAVLECVVKRRFHFLSHCAAHKAADIALCGAMPSRKKVRAVLHTALQIIGVRAKRALAA